MKGLTSLSSRLFQEGGGRALTFPDFSGPFFLGGRVARAVRGTATVETHRTNESDLQRFRARALEPD